MNQILCCDWVYELAKIFFGVPVCRYTIKKCLGQSISSNSDLCTLAIANANTVKSYVKPWANIYGLLTKFVRSRSLDINQVLFSRVYGPRWRRGPWTRKIRIWPISSHLDRRASLVNKGFIIWLWGNVSWRTRRVVPSGRDSSILPPRVANHSTEFKKIHSSPKWRPKIQISQN